MLTDTSLEAGEFNFDQSYNEIVKLNEEDHDDEVKLQCRNSVKLSNCSFSILLAYLLP